MCAFAIREQVNEKPGHALGSRPDGDKNPRTRNVNQDQKEKAKHGERVSIKQVIWVVTAAAPPTPD